MERFALLPSGANNTVIDRNLEVRAFPRVCLRPKEGKAHNTAGAERLGWKIADECSQSSRVGVAVDENRPVDGGPPHARRRKYLEAQCAASRHLSNFRCEAPA